MMILGMIVVCLVRMLLNEGIVDHTMDVGKFLGICFGKSYDDFIFLFRDIWIRTMRGRILY